MDPMGPYWILFPLSACSLLGSIFGWAMADVYQEEGKTPPARIELFLYLEIPAWLSILLAGPAGNLGEAAFVLLFSIGFFLHFWYMAVDSSIKR